MMRMRISLVIVIGILCLGIITVLLFITKLYSGPWKILLQENEDGLNRYL